MTKLTDYNPFDHLLVEDELSQYLTEAYEDEDPAVFVVALGHAIKHQGVAQVAEANWAEPRKSLQGDQWPGTTQVAHHPPIDARVGRAFVRCDIDCNKNHGLIDASTVLEHDRKTTPETMKSSHLPFREGQFDRQCAKHGAGQPIQDSLSVG